MTLSYFESEAATQFVRTSSLGVRMRQHQPPRSGRRAQTPIASKLVHGLAHPLLLSPPGGACREAGRLSPGAGADINGCILVRNAFIILTILPRSSSVSTAGVLQIRSECLERGPFEASVAFVVIGSGRGLHHRQRRDAE